jgi:4-carboxymuconolactone decarboxylase
MQRKEIAMRMAPLSPPYESSVEELLASMMPRSAPVPPLVLFRTWCRHRPLSEALRALGSFLLGRGLLAAADRELVILRTCARCGAAYEWGVHAAGLAPRSGLSAEAIEATLVPDDGASPYSSRERILIDVADALHDSAGIDDALWARLAEGWRPEEILELVALAGFYHLVAFSVNALALDPEPWAGGFERFP